MQKAIKFRGYSIRDKKWIYGNHIYDINSLATILSNIPTPSSFLHDDSLVYRESVGLFTEFLDKNGVEIYESDILKCQSQELTMSIYWDLTADRWQFEELDIYMDDGQGRGDWSLTQKLANSSEVIGNTYQNPKLLTQSMAHKNNPNTIVFIIMCGLFLLLLTLFITQICLKK